MRIGIVILRMSFSGAENVADALISEFRRKGHEVHVILTCNNSNIKDKQYIHDASYNGNRLLRTFKRSIRIREIVKAENLDVVVGFGLVDSIHMLRALTFFNITKVACERMDPATYPFKKSQRIERNIMYRFLDGMILQTSGQKEFYERFLNTKMAVIPNPVRSVDFMALPVEQRKKEFVTVARLDNAQKNHLFMFDCFSEFLESHPDYVLKLYGDGPDRKVYEEYIEKNKLGGKILLCGKVAAPQNEIKASTAFLLTSNHEGMPNALIEAMSIGLPCISTDCGGGGAKDLINNMDNGILVNKCDKKEFVNAMCKVADSIDLQRRLGENALKINEDLSIEKIADQWIKAFEMFKRNV